MAPPARRSRSCRVAGRLARLALASLLVPVGGSEVRAQGTQLPAQLVQQLEALGAWINSRTPVQQKLDSNLLLEKDRRRGGPMTNALSALRSGVEVNDDGTVLVDIQTQVTLAVLNAIEGAGGTIVSSYAQYDAIRARLPLDRLEALAARPEVRFLRPFDRAMTNAGPKSEGDVAHRADLARSTFGVDGTGITVGVLSDSIDELAALQASGDLPPDCPQSGACVTVLPGQSGNPGSSEGTAMLEIVHDLAPGAKLSYATACCGVTATQASFAANILAQAAGADVIVDDIAFFAEPVFQDGIIAQAVDTVAALGVAYFSSAGNSGNLNDGTSGVFQGNYVPGVARITGPGPEFAPLYSSCHDFGAGAAPFAETNQITQGSGSGIYNLHWAEPQGMASTDYDLFLANAGFLALLGQSTNSQTGVQDPYERILSSSSGVLLVCLKIASPSTVSRFLHLNTNRGRLGVSTNGQTAGHSVAVGAFSVAAVDASPPAGPRTPFDGTESVETFSSDGPRKIFFDAGGTPLANVTNGITNGGPFDRQKPDIAAADGVTTATPGFSPFFGTSAAAPHAAAIAALMLQKGEGSTGNVVLTSFPTTLAVSLATIRSALTSTAIDIEAAGVDQDSGAGIIDAFAAVNAIPTGSPPFTDPVLTVGFTVVKKVHIEELRTRIDALRAAKTLGPFGFTDPTLTANVTQAKGVHISDLRTALAEAYAPLPAPVYTTDPIITAGATLIKADHILELRNFVKALE